MNNNAIIRIILIVALIFQSSLSFAQIMEIKGGVDIRSISSKTNGSATSSRVIIQSNLALEYTTNFGDIPRENIASGIVNELNVDTLYFFLDPNDNKRRLTISCQGYASEIIPLQLMSKTTYNYVIFDPYLRANTPTTTSVSTSEKSNNNEAKPTNKVAGKEKLPSWILEAQGNGRYVGVSDPSLSKNEAFNQALLRAWMLYQMDIQFSIEGASMIMQRGGVDNYESNSKISSLKLNSIVLYAGREYISNYGELFVEFFTSPTGSAKSAKYNFTLADKTKEGFVLTQYILYNDQKSATSIDGFIGFPNYENDYFSKTKVYRKGGEDIDNNLNITQFEYKGTLPDTSKPQLGKRVLRQDVMSSDGTKILSGGSLDEGYWYAFISSLFGEAELFSIEQNVQMSVNSSNTTTTYSNGQSDDLIQHTLSEMINNNDMRISLSMIQIKDNQLYGEWSTNIIESNKEITITGRVVDSKNKPMIGATITIPGSTVGTVADIDGYYSLTAETVDEINLIAQFVKYTSVRKNITVESGKTNYVIDFIMKRK